MIDWLLLYNLGKVLDKIGQPYFNKFLPLFGMFGRRWGVVVVLRGMEPKIKLRGMYVLLTPSVKGMELDVYGGYLRHKEYRKLEEEGNVVRF